MFFVACQTFNGERVFTNDIVVHLFHSVLEEGLEVWSFSLVAYTILPDGVELLLKLDKDVLLYELIEWVQKRYAYTYQELMGMPKPMVIWRYSYYFGLVRDVDEFAKRLDRIHHAAVKYGWTKRPEEWPYCSYEKWVEERIYKLGWGWADKRKITGARHSRKRRAPMRR